MLATERTTDRPAGRPTDPSKQPNAPRAHSCRYNLYFSSLCCGPRWYVDSDLEDSHSLASLRTASADGSPHPGAGALLCQHLKSRLKVSAGLVL